MLECVVNISEGRDAEALRALEEVVAGALLDRHTDPDHHRSVFTLVGENAPRALAAAAVDRLDLATNDGVHPRIGVVDVVPFVALAGSTEADALAARDAYADWSATSLGVPCFYYGPERTLPEVRRGAFGDLAPDRGGPGPHPTAGATAVGQRPLMVAYNLWLAEPDLDTASAIARALRCPEVRALGLAVGDDVQVSMNLVAPDAVGPAEVFERVSARAQVARAELVGLVPASLLASVPQRRWAELDLSEDRTIEARLEQLGLGAG